jgi:hypothetical protein
VVTIDQSTSENTIRTCINAVAIAEYSSPAKRGAHESVKSAMKPVVGWKSTLAGKRDGMPVCLIGRKRNGRISERASQPKVIFLTMFAQIASAAMWAP